MNKFICLKMQVVDTSFLTVRFTFFREKQREIFGLGKKQMHLSIGNRAVSSALKMLLVLTIGSISVQVSRGSRT